MVHKKTRTRTCHQIIEHFTSRYKLTNLMQCAAFTVLRGCHHQLSLVFSKAENNILKQ